MDIKWKFMLYKAVMWGRRFVLLAGKIVTPDENHSKQSEKECWWCELRRWDWSQQFHFLIGMQVKEVQVGIFYKDVVCLDFTHLIFQYKSDKHTLHTSSTVLMLTQPSYKQQHIHGFTLNTGHKKHSPKTYFHYSFFPRSDLAQIPLAIVIPVSCSSLCLFHLVHAHVTEALL